MVFFDKHLINIIKSNFNNDPASILDIGCGDGRLLKIFSDTFKDSDLIGQEVVDGETKISFINPEFSENHYWSQNLSSHQEHHYDLGKTASSEKKIKIIQNNINNDWPIKDNSIDVITSNMVLEHVQDFDLFTKNMKRVMSKNSIAIHIVPTTASFWEGHIKQPLTHRIKSEKWIKFCYSIGFGIKSERTPSEWSRMFKNEFFYRPENELNKALSSKREYDLAMLALRIFNKNFYNLKFKLPFSNIFIPSTLITRIIQ